MQRAELSIDYGDENPWWKTGDVTASPRYHPDRRSDYGYKLDSVRDNQFTMIAGAAGSGKTAILHQIAHDLIEKDGVSPQNILYLPLGDPRFQIGSEMITDAVDVFSTYYLGQDSEPTGGYVMIDDAHATHSWSKQVRWCFKQFEDLSIVVTLPTLNRANTEPIEELGIEPSYQVLLPSKFYDVVTEKGLTDLDKDLARGLRDALELAADTGDDANLQSSITAIESEVDAISEIKRSVLEYFRGSNRDEDIDTVIQNLEFAIYRDIPRYQQFDDRSDLYGLCAIAAAHSGQTLGLKDLSGVLECDRRTLQRYINLLEDFFILTPSYQYEYERRRSVRLYLRDPLLVASLTDVDFSGLIDRDSEQRLTNTVVFDHLKRLAFRYHNSNSPVHFWESGDEKVDFVVKTGDGTPLPFVINVGTPDRSPADQIAAFCDVYDCDFGVALARDVEASVHDTLVTLPLWMFLLAI